VGATILLALSQPRQSRMRGTSITMTIRSEAGKRNRFALGLGAVLLILLFSLPSVSASSQTQVHQRSATTFLPTQAWSGSTAHTGSGGPGMHATSTSRSPAAGSV